MARLPFRRSDRVEGFDPNLLDHDPPPVPAEHREDRPRSARRANRKDRPVDPLEYELDPWVTRGNETLYGYVIGAELILMAILELTDTHGKGAPAHPATWMSVAGLVASVLMLGLLQTKNRTFVALSTILASLLIDLPSVPNSLVMAKLFAVFIPIVYGIVLVRRRSRSAQIRQQAGIDTAPATGRGRTDRSGKGGSNPAPVRTTGRYTPPKSKRTQSGSSRKR